MMKPLKFPFKKHLVKKLPAYLLALAFVPSLVTYGVILRTQPKKEEVFSFFIEAKVKDASFLEDYVRAHTDPRNKEINVYSAVSSLPTFSALFQTQGLSSDLLILSEASFKDCYASSFLELKEDSPYYASTNRCVEGKHFGIRFASKGLGPLKDVITYQEDQTYYAFVNAQSVHNGGFASEAKTSQIMTLLEALENEK